MANPYPPNFDTYSEEQQVEWFQRQLDQRKIAYSPNMHLTTFQRRNNLMAIWMFVLESADAVPKVDEHTNKAQNQGPTPGTSTAPQTNTQPGATGLGIYGHESAEPGVDPEGQTGSANDNAQDTSDNAPGASKFIYNGDDSTGDELPSNESTSNKAASDNSASMDLSNDDSPGNAPGGSGEWQAPADGEGNKKRPASDEGDGEGSNKKQKTSDSGK